MTIVAHVFLKYYLTPNPRQILQRDGLLLFFDFGKFLLVVFDKLGVVVVIRGERSVLNRRVHDYMVIKNDIYILSNFYQTELR